jgi:hypothetical protein
VTQRFHLTLSERVYCNAVIATVAAGSLCLFGNDQWTAELYVFLGIVLGALFPIGVFLELMHARFPIPRLMVLCLVLTALWVGVIIKYNWREIVRFLALE